MESKKSTEHSGTSRTGRESSVMARYYFTDEELKVLALDSAEAVKKAGELADELKQTRSDFKAMIEAEQRTIATASRKLREGYEMRGRWCALRLNFGTGKREWVDVETGEVHKADDLQPEDYQLDLDQAMQQNGEASAEVAE